MTQDGDADRVLGCVSSLAAGALVACLVGGVANDAVGRGGLAGFAVVYALLAIGLFIRGAVDG